MTAPQPYQTGTSRPLIVVGSEVTGPTRKNSSLFVAEITKHQGGTPVTETRCFEGDVGKNLRSIELEPGMSLRIRNGALLGLIY